MVFSLLRQGTKNIWQYLHIIIARFRCLIKMYQNTERHTDGQTNELCTPKVVPVFKESQQNDDYLPAVSLVVSGQVQCPGGRRMVVEWVLTNLGGAACVSIRRETPTTARHDLTAHATGCDSHKTH